MGAQREHNLHKTLFSVAVAVPQVTRDRAGPRVGESLRAIACDVISRAFEGAAA